MPQPSRKTLIIVVIVGIAVLAAILIPIGYFAATSDGDNDDKKDEGGGEGEGEGGEGEGERYRRGRVDCYPESRSPAVQLTKDACERRGCVYDAEAAANTSLGVACFYPATGGLGYSITREETIAGGVRFYLEAHGRSPFGGDFRSPRLDVFMLSNDLIRFTFDDYYAVPRRYRVPIETNLPTSGADNPLYNFHVTNRTKLSFRIIRNSTGTVIFDTGPSGLVLSDQFLQLSSRLPSSSLYGLGEHSRPSFRRDFSTSHSWPAFARDQPPGGNTNLYGVHPFYTCVEDSQGNTHGVFLLNSNAQEYELSPGPMLTWRTIGGVLDFYVFLGPSPENVVQQYTQLIGRPMMPPYWSLGFQQCRYGYNNLTNMQRAVEETQSYGIPLDVQYADIDHMDERKIFTIDQVNFAGLSDYFDTLRDGGMKTIIILDPCIITNETNYEPYEEMKKVNGNILWPSDFDVPPGSSDTDGSMLGFVWPKGKVVFPDYFKSSTGTVWKDLIVSHHRNQIRFDGIWIDMNEPANFGTNEERPWNWPEDDTPYWSLHCGNNTLDDPPYRPLAAYLYDGVDNPRTLADKTLCMNGVQGERGQYRHYDVHSLYGWSQTAPTLEAARAATGERSLVITRSTFPGSGKDSGHWLGDNTSMWPHLSQSIIGMLDFNLFGIPYIGADICGFFGDTTEELCLRWMQLGAFYPFSRNHNGLGYIEQHPGALGDNVGIASREIMETRYWLLPYLYTLFHHAHTQGDTVVRPLHHEFPMDRHALGIDQQFLWGRALLISPILKQGQTELRYYLPSARWYDFYTGELTVGPVNKTVPVSLMSKPKLHLRGGHVIVLQRPANNTQFSRKNTFQIRAMLDNTDVNNGSASGSLFWDDGSSVDTYENGNYLLTNYRVQNRTLHVKVAKNNVSEALQLRYEDVIVYGVTSALSVIVTKSDGTTFLPPFSFDPNVQMLTVTLNDTLMLADNFTLTWKNSQGRVDCYPDARSPAVTLTQQLCEERGCEYDEQAALSNDGSVVCFYPREGGLTYSLSRREVTEKGFKLYLTASGPYPFGGNFTSPVLDVQMLDNQLLRFTFDDEGAGMPRYRVPINFNLPTSGADNPLYTFNITDEARLSFVIIRKATGTIIFDTGPGGLVLSDQFLQLTTRLPSTNLYGLGENTHTSFRRQFHKTNSWAAFARDQFPGSDNNLYGVHPFYTCVEDSQGNTHGVFLLNSNAQEYELSPGPMLTWRTIGGVLDFYVFLGPSPENVVQQYTQMIGRPMMPPYWSLGFQLCRYGYNNLTNMQRAVEETKKYGIPQDVQYADIDHMDERKIFTIDQVNFAGLSDYFDTLRDGGMKTIIILDPCIITNETNYEPYEEMKKVNGNILWPSDFDVPANSSDDDGSMLGFVWPKGKVVFPDYFKGATHQVWKDLVVKHHRNQIRFDGIWIDMNEPANFGTNEERPWNWPEDDTPYWSLQCRNNTWDDPPYRPLAAYMYDGVDNPRTLADKTLCMNGVQGERGQYRHYDVHSLYGWSQTAPTLEAARAATGERSLVVTRSTFPGSGKGSGHWLGDNASVWKHLHDSIIGMLDFNLFGIPYIGADICGFFDNTTEELCLRWMQLGAFYPYSRNHNGIGFKEQHPGALGDNVGIASREIMESRYWLLPYLYTLFHYAHTLGDTVVRPLHHEFPMDFKVRGIDRQFMWGPALLISPILYEGQTELNYYLPPGRWYHFYTGALSIGPSEQTVPVSLMSKPELHLRGGHVIVLQAPANNTHFSRQNSFQIRAMLDGPDTENGSASGSLFWDDGLSVDTFENGIYTLVNYRVQHRTLHVAVASNNGVPDVDSLSYSDVIIYGVTAATNVTVTKTGDTSIYPQFTFDGNIQMLNITLDDAVTLSESFTVSWQ